MIGKTNAGGGGGSNFAAYLEVSTDAYAVITAVNLAGDTYSGTADSSGDLTLTIRKPGTYTVTETGGGSKTVVVADDGETYEVRIIAFDGSLIVGGVEVIDNGFSAEAYQTGAWTGSVPLISSVTYGTTQYIAVDLPSGGSKSGIYVTTDAVSITDFSTYSFYGHQVTGSYCVAFAIDETGTEQWNLGNLPDSDQTATFGLNALDPSKKWRFGIWIYDVGHAYINELKLI